MLLQIIDLGSHRSGIFHHGHGPPSCLLPHPDPIRLGAVAVHGAVLGESGLLRQGDDFGGVLFADVQLLENADCPILQGDEQKTVCVIEAEILCHPKGVVEVGGGVQCLHAPSGENQPASLASPFAQGIYGIPFGIVHGAPLHTGGVFFANEGVIPKGAVMEKHIRRWGSIPKSLFDPVIRTDGIECEGDLIIEGRVNRLQIPSQTVVQNIQIRPIELRCFLAPDPRQLARFKGNAFQTFPLAFVLHPTENDPPTCHQRG